MEDDLKRIQLIRQVLGKDVKPPTVYPATWHNRRRHNDVGVSGDAEQLNMDPPGHAKPTQNPLGRAMDSIKQYARLIFRLGQD